MLLLYELFLGVARKDKKSIFYFDVAIATRPTKSFENDDGNNYDDTIG